MRAYASARLTLPARMLLISVPVSTIPASNVSSIVNSCRALRLRAMVSRSSGSVLALRGRTAHRWRWPASSASADARTPARGGPASDLLCEPPDGYRSRRSHLRRGGAATVITLHITSFRSSLTVPERSREGNRQVRRRGRASSRRPGARRSRHAARRAVAGRAGASSSSALSRTGSSPGRQLGRRRHRDVRRQAGPVDPALVGREPLLDRQPEAAVVALERRPLLDRPLAERRSRR